MTIDLEAMKKRAQQTERFASATSESADAAAAFEHARDVLALLNEVERLRAEKEDSDKLHKILHNSDGKLIERLTRERDEALAAMSSDGADAVMDNAILRAKISRMEKEGECCVKHRESKVCTDRRDSKEWVDMVAGNSDGDDE